MYLTATISVALVLLLVGAESVLLISCHQLIRRVKENVAVTVLVKEAADSAAIHSLETSLRELPYATKLQFISKQQALQEHIDALGEDPQKFLGYNPLSNSFELHLKAEYANADSLVWIDEQLKEFNYVEDVNYPQEIVSVLDMHVGEISVALVLVAVVLLLISLVLIMNTVRLHVYSKRFLIHTMRLVGATSWVIRSPFIKRNLRMGLEAAVMALFVLFAVIVLVHERLGIWVCELTWQNLLIVELVVIGVGVFITFVASMIATGRYLRMKTDKMYEI